MPHLSSSSSFIRPTLTLFFVMTFIGDRRYEPLGCYEDKVNNRTLPILITNLRGRINWNDMSKTIDKCANETTKKDHRLKVFALQFYGECYSGSNGLESYKRYRALPYSENDYRYCCSGVGARGTNFVYKYIDE